LIGPKWAWGTRRSSARHLAVELRVAEQRGALALVAHLGRLALREEALVAHEAVAAGDVEGDDDAVARLDVADARSDRLDDPHRLVSEDVALLEEGAQHLVQVQVGAADAARRDADDRVGVGLDRRVGNGLHPDVPPAVPCQCLHRALSFAVDGRAGTTALPLRNVRGD
jgi:hypothetical protein